MDFILLPPVWVYTLVADKLVLWGMGWGSPFCNTGWFPQSKYCHHGQFQPTNSSTAGRPSSWIVNSRFSGASLHHPRIFNWSMCFLSKLFWCSLTHSTFMQFKNIYWMSYSLYIAAVTNYHKLNSLRQHSFVSSQFCQSEVQHGMAEFSAQDLTGLKPRYQQGCILIQGSGFFSKPTDFCQN